MEECPPLEVETSMILCSEMKGEALKRVALRGFKWHLGMEPFDRVFLFHFSLEFHCMALGSASTWEARVSFFWKEEKVGEVPLEEAFRRHIVSRLIRRLSFFTFPASLCTCVVSGQSCNRCYVMPMLFEYKPDPATYTTTQVSTLSLLI